MNVQTFDRRTPGREMFEARRLWKTADPNVFKVYGRDGNEYFVGARDGVTYCDCPARGGCWHLDLLRERRPDLFTPTPAEVAAVFGRL